LPDFRHYLYPFGVATGQMCAQNIAPPHNDAMSRYFRPPNAGGKRKFILIIFSAIYRRLPQAVQSKDSIGQQVALHGDACPFTGLLQVLTK
jgi:hypothetical protein